MAGYSGTPLAKKLGIKEHFIMMLINEPGYYFDLFSDFPEVDVTDSKKVEKDFIHFFTKEEKVLKKQLPVLKKQLKQNGMIWVSWPKKAAKIPTDITEDVIRNFALEQGLVDIKVCAIDDTWSALKLVIPVKDRK
jgi:hypothetical protein